MNLAIDVDPGAPAAPGRRGRLELRFEWRDGRTCLTDGYAEPPFLLTRVFYPLGPDLAHLILVHATAGLFGGDEIAAQISVGPRARVIVTSQAAQKLHPSGGRDACQSLNLHVEADGELHCHLEPVIPFTAARLVQRTRIDAADRATVVWSDGWMSGRVRRPEQWKFDRLDLETRLHRDGRLLFLERVALDGGASATRRWAMHDGQYVASVIVHDPRATEEACDGMHAALFAGAPGVAGALDRPAEGLIVGRIVASDGESFRARLRHVQSLAFESILGEPAPAVRPRWGCPSGE